MSDDERQARLDADERNEIERRHVKDGDPADPHCAFCSDGSYPIWPCDAAWLLAEVERLEAERDAVQAERDELDAACTEWAGTSRLVLAAHDAMGAELAASQARERALRDLVASFVGQYTSGDWCAWCQKFIAECSAAPCVAGQARAALAAAGLGADAAEDAQ